MQEFHYAWLPKGNASVPRAAPCQGKMPFCPTLFLARGPDVIRTRDPWFRKPVLYPAELRNPAHLLSTSFLESLKVFVFFGSGSARIYGTGYLG